MNLCVIIPAAGRSTRFGGSDKLAQDMGGRPLLVRTVEAFTKHELVRSILVAGPPHDFDAFRERFGATLSFHGAALVPGSEDARWRTVRAALEHVPGDATHVAIHDAARPAVSPELLDRILDAARAVPAVIPAVDITGTVKRLGDETRDVHVADDADVLADSILGGAGRTAVDSRIVESTVDRRGLAIAQTPQVFELGLLRRAYAADDLDGVTDDAMAVERLGETVYAVKGDPTNIKVTTPEDLRIVRTILGVKPDPGRAAHLRF